MAYTTINKPTDYFNTVLYTGNGSTQSITGIGFQPDWVWIKNRSGTDIHALYDSVRGANKNLRSDDTAAEGSQSTGLTSFDSDGFAVGDTGSVNTSSNNFVSWNWLASNTTASNSNGSITSTVSANTTAGFSIVSFTGTASNATVGHGLGVAPDCIITKSRVNAENWGFYHQSLGGGKQLELNTTAAVKTSSAYYNDTSPTSTVFSIGTADSTNDNQNMIAYCFAEKKGYSKIGQYEGNANVDGTFVYTGFLPAWVMVKNIDATENWIIFDNKRPGYNLTDALLKPSLNNAESTSGVKFDLVSNGFKARVSDAEGNSSNTFIYMAFAEHPFVSSTGTPVTAG